MATISSFPNNADEFIGAGEVMHWLYGRTSGVYGAQSNLSVIAGADGMYVLVSDGVGWLTAADKRGIVFWNDEESSTSNKLSLTIDTAHAQYDRIDRVVVSWTVGDFSAKPEIKVLKGTASSSPVAPSLTNDAIKREISLAQVYVASGASSIVSANVTDERLDNTVCGLVNETISVDTTTINSQVMALIESLEEEIRRAEGGSLYELHKLVFNNQTVASSAWSSDSTYDSYPYRASVPLSGVNGTMYGEVIFTPSDIAFAPVCETYSGGVYIYCADSPSASITIPTIVCWRS